MTEEARVRKQEHGKPHDETMNTPCVMYIVTEPVCKAVRLRFLIEYSQYLIAVVTARDNYRL